mgnify:CR=1 FL=1
MRTSLLALSATALLALSMTAFAAGELNIYNWGNYTNPDLIKKFEKTYDVKVTVTDYDSNTTALTKIEAGGHGFDIVVPTGNYVPIYVEKGLLLESRPDQMENFKNVSESWKDVPWDPKRHYTVPWQWGTTGVAVDTSVYGGDINTSAIFLDPLLLGGFHVLTKQMPQIIGLLTEIVNIHASPVIEPARAKPVQVFVEVRDQADEVVAGTKHRWLLGLHRQYSIGGR